MHGHAAPEVQHQAAGVFDELRRAVHHLLQHRLDAPALGRVADRRELAGQPELADQAQAVVGERGQMHDRVVGVELARGQALEVQVGLDLGVAKGSVTKALLRGKLGLGADRTSLGEA